MGCKTVRWRRTIVGHLGDRALHESRLVCAIAGVGGFGAQWCLFFSSIGSPTRSDSIRATHRLTSHHSPRAHGHVKLIKYRPPRPACRGRRARSLLGMMQTDEGPSRPIMPLRSYGRSCRPARHAYVVTATWPKTVREPPLACSCVRRVPLSATDVRTLYCHA
jgi:hypothetical protein